MLAETSTRRNKLEKGLRSVVRRALQQNLGREKATQAVLAAIHSNRRDKLSSTPLADLLDADSSPLFFLDLINIISKNWAVFQNIFEKHEKARILQLLQDINDIGRPDAHAKGIGSDDFAQLRLHYKRIEPIVEDWL